MCTVPKDCHSLEDVMEAKRWCLVCPVVVRMTGLVVKGCWLARDSQNYCIDYLEYYIFGYYLISCYTMVLVILCSCRYQESEQGNEPTKNRRSSDLVVG